MSNKTPKKQPDETASAPSSEVSRRSKIRLFIGIVMIGIGVLALFNGIFGLTDNKQRLMAPNGFISVALSDTPELRQLGLSDYTSLAKDEGMLFFFESASVANCFWMKDMDFSIDMIWLNEQKEVVTVTANVSPDTYPEQSFCPTEAAYYGLEVPANQAQKLGIEVDKTLRF
jgi:uncharacterized membrane protein (UPF0127 family)